MPDYVFITEEKVEHRHELTIELPIDMGDSSERLTDRMARTVAENKAIDGGGDHETVVAVFRDGMQIWPRKHKKEKPLDTYKALPLDQTLPPKFEEDDE